MEAKPANNYEALALLAENMRKMHLQLVQRERVVLFLDNSNFFGSVSRISRAVPKYRVDHHKLLKVLVGDRFRIDALCYCSEWEADAEARAKRDGFQAMMSKAGYTLVRVPQKAGAVREKGLDAAVVSGMVTVARECPRADTFVLIAGDGDYTETVRDLRRKQGVKVEVAFFASETAYSLREAAHTFIDLEPLRSTIQQGGAFTE